MSRKELWPGVREILAKGLVPSHTTVVCLMEEVDRLGEELDLAQAKNNGSGMYALIPDPPVIHGWSQWGDKDHWRTRYNVMIPIPKLEDNHLIWLLDYFNGWYPVDEVKLRIHVASILGLLPGTVEERTKRALGAWNLTQDELVDIIYPCRAGILAEGARRGLK